MEFLAFFHALYADLTLEDIAEFRAGNRSLKDYLRATWLNNCPVFGDDENLFKGEIARGLALAHTTPPANTAAHTNKLLSTDPYSRLLELCKASRRSDVDVKIML